MREPRRMPRAALAFLYRSLPFDSVTSCQRSNRLAGPVMPLSPLSPLSGPEMDRLWAWFIAEVPEHAILMLDRDGRIAGWNRAAESLMRHTAQQIIGRHCACL